MRCLVTTIYGIIITKSLGHCPPIFRTTDIIANYVQPPAAVHFISEYIRDHELDGQV